MGLAAATKAVGVVVPLLLTKGINNSAESVKMQCLQQLLSISKVAGKALEPHAPDLRYCLSLSLYLHLYLSPSPSPPPSLCLKLTAGASRPPVCLSMVLLEYLSTLEPASFNYYQFHVGEEKQEALESARMGVTTSSPAWQTLEVCAQVLSLPLFLSVCLKRCLP